MKLRLQIFMKSIAFPRFILFLVVGQLQLAQAQNSTAIHARPITQLPSVVAECSGISFAAPNRLWSHNDAGNTNQLFCFDTTGVLLRTLLIANASNIDWEDLAVDDQGRIYVNDAGNNQNDRRDLKIYRIPNPEIIPEDVTNAEVINFMFEDQTAFPPPANERNFDIEAMVWKNDSLFLFTKNRSNPQTGLCKMYSLPAAPGFYAAKLRGSVFLGATNQEARVTSADIHPQTGELLLLTSTKIVSFRNYPGTDFFDGDMNEHHFIHSMGQIEALAYGNDNTIFLAEEGSGQNAGWLYEVIWDSVSAVDESPFSGISVFPNPFVNRLFFENPKGQFLHAEIFDVHGNVISRKTIQSGQMDTSDLPGGIYVLRITSKNRYFATKILKH